VHVGRCCVEIGRMHLVVKTDGRDATCSPYPVRGCYKFGIARVANRDFMTKDEVRSKLKPIFESVLDVDDLDLRDDLSADDVPEWDSLSHVRLLVTVERQFKIKFSNSEIEGLKNVGDLIRLVMTKVG